MRARLTNPWDDPSGVALVARSVDAMKRGDPSDVAAISRAMGANRGRLGLGVLDLVNLSIEWRNCVTSLADDTHRALILPETIELLRSEGFTVDVEKRAARLSRLFHGDRRVFCIVRRPARALAAGGQR